MACDRQRLCQVQQSERTVRSSERVHRQEPLSNLCPHSNPDCCDLTETVEVGYSISFPLSLLRFSQPWLVLQLVRFQAGDFHFNGKSADAQISTGAWSALRNSTTCYSLQLISPFSVWSAMQWSSWVTGLLLR